MIAPGLVSRRRRNPAKPLPGATWQAQVLDAGAITAELNRLWARFGGATRRDLVSQDQPPDDDVQATSVLTRASTLNLVAVARTRADSHLVEDAVNHLSDLYPSRATILVANPERLQATDVGLDVRVALLEQEGRRGQPAVRFECVTVEVSAANERHLASIASPLLVADLPDFLWWVGGEVSASQLFEHLLSVSDRLIVDSAAFGDQAKEMVHLAALVERTSGCPKLSDFTWARLAPWRHLITQFFDPAVSREALDTLDEVEIWYGDRDQRGGSGLSAALLLAGWLGSRLAWQAPGELLPMGDGSNGWKATLRSGDRGRRREVAVTLRPRAGDDARRCLSEVRLAARGGHAGLFRVERLDALGLQTSSEGPDMPAVQRMVYAAVPDDAALLADELGVFGRDLVFEEALSFASRLAPETGDGASE